MKKIYLYIEYFQITIKWLTKGPFVVKLEFRDIYSNELNKNDFRVHAASVI
jgi:hypothetical protein